MWFCEQRLHANNLRIKHTKKMNTATISWQSLNPRSDSLLSYNVYRLLLALGSAEERLAKLTLGLGALVGSQLQGKHFGQMKFHYVQRAQSKNKECYRNHHALHTSQQNIEYMIVMALKSRGCKFHSDSVRDVLKI